MAKLINKNDGDKKAAGAKKSAAKQKKPRKSPIAYIKEVIAELKKVSWPTRKEITSYSLVVVVFIVLMAGVLFLMDTVFGKLLDLILSI